MYDEVKKDPSKKIEKDIGKFKSFRELYDAISNAEDVELSDRQKLRRRQADQNYDIVYEDYKKIDKGIHCFDYLRDIVTNKGCEVLERNDVINDRLWDTSKIKYLDTIK